MGKRRGKQKIAAKLLSGLLTVCVGIGTIPATVHADNPIVQNIYTADPAPMVYGDTLYVYTGHDEDNATWYEMNDWKCYSTKDMVNWTDHGTILDLDTFSWVKSDAWAGQCIEKNGKFYFYAPVTSNTGQTAIGVAVADTPVGPFKDAIGAPLIMTQEGGDIDPTVFIDNDGQAYLYWGNPALKYVKLNEDMISYSGEIVTVELTEEGFRKDESGRRPTLYEEGPWIYRRGDIYYLLYAAGMPEHIAYSTSNSPTGPWTFAGVVMPAQGASFTNHPGIVDFRGHSYFFYHNGMLPGGSGFTRSVAVEEFTYGENGKIPQMNMTKEGPDAIGNLNPYVRTEAETMAWGSGIETEAHSGGVNICDIQNDDYIKVENVDFGEKGAGAFTASVACGNQSGIQTGGNVELRLDSADGTLIGKLPVSYTGGWDNWVEKTAAVSNASGTHDLYLVFQGEHDKDLFHMDYWKFTEKSEEKSLADICVSLDAFKIDTAEGDNTAQICVEAVYGDGSSEDVTANAQITVKPESIAEISAETTKVVTAKEKGEAVIQAAYQGKTGTVHLLVADWALEQSVKRLVLEQDTLEVKAGTSKSITVTAEFLGGHTEDITKKAAYTSMDTEIAEVSEGMITAKKIGETEVKIRYRGKKGEEKESVIKVIVPPVNPYEKVEAETFSDYNGENLTKYGCADEGGTDMIGGISPGDWVKYAQIGFGDGAKIFKARAASGGRIQFEIKLDSPEGKTVGTMDADGTGDWDIYQTVSCSLDAVSGTHDVYIVFQGAVNFNWWQCVARSDEPDSCIASFSFDDETTGFSDTKTGAKAEASGTNVLSSDEKMEGKSLYLDGSGSNYLTVKDADGGSLLADYEEITVSYWSKVDGTASNTNWGFFVNKAGASVYERKYIGMIERGGSVTLERCRDTSDGSCESQPTSKDGIANNEWKLVTAVFTENETKLYINKECVRTETDKKLSSIFDGNSTFYIGKADWNEFFTGYLDEFRVYNYARSEDEIARYYDMVKNGENYDDREAADAAIQKIQGIGNVELTDACKAKIEEARKAYSALTDAQKALVSAEILKILTDAETEYKRLEEEQGSQNPGQTDQEKADAVKKLIEGIGTVSLDSKEKIEAARAAYNALTDAQKALVSEETLKILTDAETEYKRLEEEQGSQNPGQTDQEKADAVKKLIEGIGTVSLESKEKIEAARAAYNALTDAQKALVSEETLKILTDAETEYKRLEEEQGSQNPGQTDQEKADAVKKLIEDIGTVSLESKEKIEAARAAYNALTDAQKALVSADTLKILTDAEAAYRKLSEEGNKPPVTEKISISKAQISAIPSQVYTGKAIVPSITVSYNGKNLAKDSDYTVSCHNNVNIGTASLTVTGAGGYTGTVTKTFTITVKKNKVYTAGNYKYKITSAKTNGKGTVALTGVKSASVKKKLTKLNIASTVKIGGTKFVVTEIGKNAFSGCAKATSATVGANVTKIGQKAFYNCKKLKKISIKTTKLKSIGKNAIKGISAKATISCPKKQKAKYKKLFKSSVGFKKSMKIK